jgi:ATP-dependent RNA helicase RhlE
MISDIERLIKKKIELEPLELEEERAPRRPRYTTEDERFEREPRRVPSAPVVMPVSDPLFDRPYEPSAAPVRTSRDTETDVPAIAALNASPNIKAKKKVAALFGAKKTPLAA